MFTRIFTVLAGIWSQWWRFQRAVAISWSGRAHGRSRAHCLPQDRVQGRDLAASVSRPQFRCDQPESTRISAELHAERKGFAYVTCIVEPWYQSRRTPVHGGHCLTCNWLLMTTWLAICKEPQCLWNLSASSKAHAEIFARWHRLAYEGRGHRTAIVQIPGDRTLDSPPAQNTPAAPS